MRSRWVSFACLILSSVTGCLALYAQTETIDHAVEQINEKRNNVSCVYYKAEGTITFPKQTVSSPDGKPRIRESAVKPCSLEVLIDFETPRFQIHYISQLPHHELNTDRITKYSEHEIFFNFERGLWASDDLEDYKRYGRKKITTKELPYFAYPDVRPFYVAHGFLPWHKNEPRPYNEPVTRDDFVDLRDEAFRGKACTVLRTKALGPFPQQYHDYWFEKETWNVVRIDYCSSHNQHCRDSLEIEYQREDITWIPKSCTWNRYHIWKGEQKDTAIDRIYKYKITEFRLNPDYDSLRHEFDVGDGVRLRDR